VRAMGAAAQRKPTCIAASAAYATRRSSASCTLQYSLELSLPHLPNRAPFTNAKSGCEAAVQGDTVSALLPPPLKAVEVGGKEWEHNKGGQNASSLHPRWAKFVQLCNAITTTAASQSAAATTTGLPSQLAGITIPCKEPYFCAAANDTDTRASATLSTIQAAVLLFHEHWHVPVTLALNTTVANRTIEEQQEHHGAADLGASLAGIQAVVKDFVQRRGGRTVLLVRGDSPSTQHGTVAGAAVSSPSPSSSSPAPSASELHTSSDLIRCVRDALQDPTVQVVVAGYPQGHPLDRHWGSPSAAAATTVAATTATADAASSVEGHTSSAFLHQFEADFNAADSLYERVVESHVTSSTFLPALHHLFHTLGRLHAVRRLWLTPSTYSAEARVACTRQLIKEKVLQSAHGGAGAIVTQVLASAQEFTQFHHDVQRALRDCASPSSSSPSATVKVIPGILLPHPTDANVLLRTLYYAKVVPSARMQRALETYRTDLKSLWRSIVTHNHTADDDDEAWLMSPRISMNEDGEAAAAPRIHYSKDVAEGYMSTWPGTVVLHSKGEVAAVEALVHDAHNRAAVRFAAAWLAETVELLSEVRQRSGEQTPVHFFTMFNDKVDVRLAQLLEAYATKQQKASSCLPHTV
jgi:5,10-methylenetetrahydrofolate reductase